MYAWIGVMDDGKFCSLRWVMVSSDGKMMEVKFERLEKK
jgi:hypothetical protein